MTFIRQYLTTLIYELHLRREHARLKRMTAQTFEQWFDDQKFKHFKAHEFTSYFARERNGVKNSPPPIKLWENIIPTLRILDRLRDHLDAPITIVSSYRSPAYNRAIGGASKSEHLQFKAIDFTVRNHSPRVVMAVLRTWRDKKQFTGGIGQYPTFNHLDTRPYNAMWGGA